VCCLLVAVIIVIYYLLFIVMDLSSVIWLVWFLGWML